MIRKAILVLLLAALSVGPDAKAEAAFGTDIIGRTAVTSFKALLDALELPPALDGTDKVWILTAPDGKAAFGWRAEAKEGRMFDVYLCFDIEPFVKAGLDADKLPSEMKRTPDGGKLLIGKKLSAEPLVYDGEVTPLSSFEQIVKLDRDAVGYHAALDHYGVTVSDGFLVEWAKDLSKNDKDLVFALEPEVFIDAGVDPAKVEGWVFAKVPLEDSRGRPFEAEKFLKPFNLK
jgi:hypothetical protein